MVGGIEPALPEEVKNAMVSNAVGEVSVNRPVVFPPALSSNMTFRLVAGCIVYVNCGLVWLVTCCPIGTPVVGAAVFCPNSYQVFPASEVPPSMVAVIPLLANVVPTGTTIL